MARTELELAARGIKVHPQRENRERRYRLRYYKYTAMFQSQIKTLPLIARGKVRDNYAVGDDRILMIATDRLSAFDVIMDTPIPGKGNLLTEMALFWFEKLKLIIGNHLTGVEPSTVVSSEERTQVVGRSMLVRRLNPLPIEAVVRGYLAGSGWSEYSATGQICGIHLKPGLKMAEKFEAPIFTPATKAEQGDHDENISLTRMEQIVGPVLSEQIQRISLQLYSEASKFALTRGIIVADTKFEFGLDEDGVLVLMDEILTPDSSRFWPVEEYQVGKSPPSFDKQYLRDWLEGASVNGARWNKKHPAPPLPHDVIKRTLERYQDAYKRLLI